LVILPKIGTVTIERIIRFREDYGSFKSIDDLLKFKGIGPKTLEKLKPQITL
jgi:competence protein ComEA